MDTNKKDQVTYKTLCATLRSYFSVESCLLVLNESISTDSALFANLKEPGLNGVQFAFVIENDTLCFSLVPKKNAKTEGVTVSLVGYNDLDLVDKPPSFLTEFVVFIWTKVIIAIRGETAAIAHSARMVKPEISSFRFSRGIRLKRDDGLGNNQLEFSSRATPAINTTDFYYRMDASQLVHVAADEKQDINHNQEVFFALLNESLEKPYSIFWDQQLNNCVSKLAREELQKIKMYGMMLWDQYRDSGIENTVNRFYSALQEFAGNNFKFMPMFSRSEHLHRNGRKEFYWDEIYKDVEKKITTDEFFTHVVLDALHVENKNIPYLILTDSLTSHRILLVCLKGVNLMDLIYQIGNLCSTKSMPLEVCQQELQRLGYASEIRELGHISEIGEFDNRTFAQRLIGPLAGVMLNPVSGISVQTESVGKLLDKSREALANIRHKMDLALEEIESFDCESEKFLQHRKEYEALCIEQLNLAVVNASRISDYEQCCLSKEFIENLDSESRINLMSALKGLALNEYFRDDYSPIIIALGKMFENEINLSLVQFIRKHLNISMPEYYCNLYPPNQGSFKIGDTDFNRSNMRNQWQPPECGKTQKVIFHNPSLWEEIVSTYPHFFENLQDINHKDLCFSWYGVCMCRNNAAHPNKYGHSPDNLKKMQAALKKLNEMGCFGLMKNLRDSLSQRA